MRRLLLSGALVFISLIPYAQSKDEAAIRQVLADQAIAWNQGSLDQFMQGYWQNDSLLFIGNTGITYGYAQALDHYKKSYSDPDKMGKLFFTVLKINKLSPDYYFVIGKWLLKRKVGDIGGIYTLLFRQIDGHWLIVADHTSQDRRRRTLRAAAISRIRRSPR